jgi:DNA-binding response OmpR family regulator
VSKILIVDDDKSLVDVLSFALSNVGGFDVVKVTEGKEAVEVWRREHPDLVVLDANLPDADGFDICRVARSEHKLTTPVIMLTARTLEDDMARGFAAGADDYVTKPFSTGLLLARMNAVLRRTGPAPPESWGVETLTVGTTRLDPETNEFTRNGVPIRLTPTEFRLLYLLLLNRNQVVRTDVIIERVWGRDASAEGGSLKTHIRHLREKVEADPSRPELIVTVPGVGYMGRLIEPESRGGE